MQSRLLINIVLLLAVTGLASLLVNSPEDEVSNADVKLTSLDPATVTRIMIRQPQGSTISFKKENKQWHMQQPYALAANEARINTMLRLLQAHSYTQFKQDSVDLARFLLDTPAVSIRFNDTQIDFGDTSPIAEQRYVLTGDTVHLINDSLFEQLQAPATFFLSTRLLPADAEIQGITFPEHNLTKENNIWKIEPPAGISADQIVKAVSAWQRLDAISIREYVPAKNHGIITVDPGTAGTIDFIMVSPPPQLVLARPDLGLQYHISGDDAEQLFLPPITSHPSPVTH